MSIKKAFAFLLQQFLLEQGQARDTPQPNRSKVFELQQSNQGYGESLGVKEVQKNAKQKYSIELFWRNLILKFTL